ncbi:hypothetical protein BD408DRAFT_418689 [Parasitella parasitica]|nr:hypothetical protein BD408DRAFT_418689 [Parasitella parasitica]
MAVSILDMCLVLIIIDLVELCLLFSIHLILLVEMNQFVLFGLADLIQVLPIQSIAPGTYC